MDINGQTHEGNTPLHCLVQSKVDNSVKIRLVERLLAHGDLDVDAKNNEDCRPIFFACKMCNVVLVRFLVEKCKVDLTQKTCDGLNVLHAIVENKHGDRKKSEQQDECVEYLINECKVGCPNFAKRLKFKKLPPKILNWSNGSQKVQKLENLCMLKTAPMHFFVYEVILLKKIFRRISFC